MLIFLRSVQGLSYKLANYIDQNYRCLINDPQFFLMRKTARLEVIRQLMRLIYRRTQPFTAHKSSPSMLGCFNLAAITNQLHQSGCYTGLTLTPEIVQEIQDFAHTQICWGDRRPDLPFNLSEKTTLEAKIGKPLILGSYKDTHHYCQAIRQIIADPGLLSIASSYLGTQAVYVSSELTWSFAVPSTLNEQLKAAQVFHYDIDGYGCVKFFFYLTPVEEKNGPHIYLLKSHKNKKLLHQLMGQRTASISDEVLTKQYGSENILTICGDAGFGFVEDIYGFHKGSPPEQGSRLLLQIEFGTRAYRDPRHFERSA
ncbi:MAG: hypothetical protein HC920_06805 [Oscillatoriales cyanobacterium SM2_3_0]|nr:hypothetical protein [Oscillatoriales cyanobacterium SM2_3_0]